MELGLSTYTFPWAFGVAKMGYEARMSLVDLLHYAQQQGIGRVQVGDNFPLHLQSRADCQQWTALAQDLGIQIEIGTSDAAYKISKRAKPILFKENWQKIFELSNIREQVRDITEK